MKKIYFFVGESGSGKTHLQDALINFDRNKFTRIQTTTTRSPRPGETNGVEYHFVSLQDFQDLGYKEELVQHVKFGGNYYGTQLNEYLQPQDIGIFVCTPEGINDTINGLEELNIRMEYGIVFFMTSNQLLRQHKVDPERIARGNIRLQFIEMYSNDEFGIIPMTVLTDQDIKKHLYQRMFSELTV